MFDFNVALLAKQGWRIIHNLGSLVAQCLKARYFPIADFLKASVGYMPSYTWRSILHAKQVLEKGCFWRVGWGNSIEIWKDNWFPCQSGFKVWTPKNQSIQINYVSELINHEDRCWNHQLVESLFLSFEAQQILQIPLANTARPDQIIWGPNKRGEFSVRSAYHFMRSQHSSTLEQSSDGNQGANHWSNLWKVKTQPRHSHLVWRILHDRLPSKVALFKRGVVSEPMCTRCNAHMEDVSHIFMGCELARQVWFACPLGVRFDDQLLRGVDFKKWLADAIDGASADVLKLIFSICYEVWAARNKLCFEQVHLPADRIIKKAVQSCEDFDIQEAAARQNHDAVEPNTVQDDESVSKWIPPLFNFYKLNVDAAGPMDGNWGIGVIVRDYTGFVMVAGKWRIPCLDDASIAEAMAPKLGLQFALDLFFLHVQAESDSTFVVAAMNSTTITNNYLGLVIQDCKSIKANFSSFSCNHIRRTANQAAHGLAKSVLISGDEIWVEDIPQCISNIISLDCTSFSVE